MFWVWYGVFLSGRVRASCMSSFCCIVRTTFREMLGFCLVLKGFLSLWPSLFFFLSCSFQCRLCSFVARQLGEWNESIPEGPGDYLPSRPHELPPPHQQDGQCQGQRTETPRKLLHAGRVLNTKKDQERPRTPEEERTKSRRKTKNGKVCLSRLCCFLSLPFSLEDSGEGSALPLVSQCPTLGRALRRACLSKKERVTRLPVERKKFKKEIKNIRNAYGSDRLRVLFVLVDRSTYQKKGREKNSTFRVYVHPLERFWCRYTRLRAVCCTRQISFFLSLFLA